MKRVYSISFVTLIASLVGTFASAQTEQHISNSGAAFIRDTSNPYLGIAYRDPSGLIWGQSNGAYITYPEAETYCQERSARVPSRQDYEQLQNYLGKGSAKGYSPYTADSGWHKTEVIPGLTNSSAMFWTTTRPEAVSDDINVFDTLTGNIGTARDNSYNHNPVRCISRGALESTPAEPRTSTTGAVFTPDNSTNLGDAYRDPSGLIWGSAYKVNGQIRSLRRAEAMDYCRSMGARLPTRQEFDQLAKYLGKGTYHQYDPFTPDHNTSIIPDLVPNRRFWSSGLQTETFLTGERDCRHIHRHHPCPLDQNSTFVGKAATLFAGSTGETYEIIDGDNNAYPVRCVSHR